VTLLALVSTLCFYWITRGLGERYYLTLGGPSRPAGLMPLSLIVIPTACAAIGATGLFALLLRFSRAPLPPFLSIAAMALLVSFGAPLSLTGDTTLTTKLLLAAMQILACLVIVLGLLVFTRTKR